jgi:RNA polymerase sigma-70 factor (ECF subfamily)
MRENRTSLPDRQRELAPIIALAQAGDEEAICELYGRYAEPLRVHLWSMVGDDEVVADLLQQTFLRVLDSGLTRFRWQTDATFDSWLFRIARNLVIDRVRYQRRRPQQSWPLEELVAPDSRGRELADALVIAISRLSDAQRQVVVLHHFHGWSFPEIAAELGRSLASVHSLDFAACRHLRRHLTALRAYPETLAA